MNTHVRRATKLGTNPMFHVLAISQNANHLGLKFIAIKPRFTRHLIQGFDYVLDGSASSKSVQFKLIIFYFFIKIKIIFFKISNYLSLRF
jgi:hypothetical protein